MPDITNNRSLKEAIRLTKAKSDRLAWALKDYGYLLASAIAKDTSPEAREVEKLPPEQIPEYVARLIQDRADPTSAKTMTGWLVQQYAQGRLRLEDTGTARETLGMFEKYARKLPLGRRDLGKYVSLADVWNGVVSLAEAERDKLGGKAKKAMDRDKAYAESRILRQDEDGFTIAVPLTEFAAKWWGRGTRWCTAAEYNNRFWQYHEKAPLIVIIIPELKKQGKFQLWVTKSDFQFMDASDQGVRETMISQNWERFEAVLLHALRQNWRNLAHIPMGSRTQEIFRIAVAQNGRSLESVPEDQCTEEMCMIAVAQDAMNLRCVPESRRTKELCRIAVAQNGMALESVPAEWQTQDLCETAIKQNPFALGKIRPSLLSTDLCEMAVLLQPGALMHVPPSLMTKNLCERAILRNGAALELVPLELRDKALCEMAVGQCARAIKSVPNQLLNEELVALAVAREDWILGSVPERLRTRELCELALRSPRSPQFGSYESPLAYIPHSLLTEEFCRTSVEKNGYLRIVPQWLRSFEICEIAVRKSGITLEYVPVDLRTEELCRIAVAQNGRALRYVPEMLRTDEICSIAVAQYGLALESVPETLRTEELCKVAVTQIGRALEHVPEKLRTEELCRIAASQNGGALEHVPENLRTEEMCRIAVAQNGWALEHVPEAMRARIGGLIPPPVTAWDISLLDELVSLLSPASSPAPSGMRHA